MDLLILGGDGMLGHQLVQSLMSQYDTRATLRGDEAECSRLPKYLLDRALFGVEARHFDSVLGVIEADRPRVVVNAIGMVKQRPEASEAVIAIELNALMPHRLARACREAGSRLIHISTDCVFSGRTGGYRESEPPDSQDLYGRSKALGEVVGPGCLTLRTSIIGLELKRKAGLVEWFLSQSGGIRGYKRAVFSGLTTLEIARVIECVIEHSPENHGLYHVSSAPIDKYSLLIGLRDRLGLGLEITPDSDLVCDRSLDSSRFQEDYPFAPPTWDTMLDELADQIRERDS